MNNNLSEYIKLRHLLHKSAEVSGNEKKTNEILNEYLSKTSPDMQIPEIGGYGLAAVYQGERAGKTILIRADIDALPIPETIAPPYASDTPGVAHKCGHDGHSTILYSIADYLKENKPLSGRVVLLFQPAEETGEGAKRVIEDEKFNNLIPDFVFGFHNLPGFNLHEIIMKEGVFAAASRGYICKLFGKTSHAAEPENGISPAMALSEIIADTYKIYESDKFSELTLLTIIHARLGEVAFGTSPGYAEYMATLRAYLNDDIEKLNSILTTVVSEKCKKYNLKFEESLTEVFPATVNNPELDKSVMEICKELDFARSYIEKPFKWSEDFGHFCEKFPAYYFGIGAGKNRSALHNTDYDFPDEIIPTGRKMLIGLINKMTS